VASSRAAEGPRNPGAEVVVVYNSAVPESRGVAEHYAAARKVPPDQVIGLKMPDTETISRQEYRETIEEPLRKEIERRKWIEFVPEVRSATTNAPGGVFQRPVRARIRYLVLCYGVPLKIANDSGVVERLPDTARAEMRRNDAAVDNELCVLPRDPKSHLLSGILGNPFQGQTNASTYSPTNGLLMVARLDGPTPEIARGLVDKALTAESNGLWGRMYFDAQGTTNSSYTIGDAWILGAAAVARRVGYEAIVDTNQATFSASFPLSHVALYLGWYDSSVSGPFTLPKVEFMPGAFAYHLYSYSAPSLRGTQHWAPALLAKGAACTVGFVSEPFLQATINLNAFLALWIRGFTYGEAIYGAMNVFSWQTTVVGDPLYRPFGTRADELHARLVQTRDPMLEWSILRAINQNILVGDSRATFISMLERDPVSRRSPVLLEKLAGFYLADSRLVDATDTYLSAHHFSLSPAQRQRIALELQRPLTLLGREARAAELLETILKDNPDYADKPDVYRRLVGLARKQGKAADAAKYQAELDRLLQPPAPAPAATNAVKSVPNGKKP